LNGFSAARRLRSRKDIIKDFDFRSDLEDKLLAKNDD